MYASTNKKTTITNANSFARIIITIHCCGLRAKRKNIMIKRPYVIITVTCKQTTIVSPLFTEDRLERERAWVCPSFPLEISAPDRRVARSPIPSRRRPAPWRRRHRRSRAPGRPSPAPFDCACRRRGHDDCSAPPLPVCCTASPASPSTNRSNEATEILSSVLEIRASFGRGCTPAWNGMHRFPC